MTFKLFCTFVFLFVACQTRCAFAKEKGDAVRQEAPCSSEGGMCYKKENCGEIPKEGLCPKQQKLGVECCFKIIGPNQTEPSKFQEKCGTGGAACMLRCPDSLLDPTGLCVDNLRCCVLV